MSDIPREALASRRRALAALAAGVAGLAACTADGTRGAARTPEVAARSTGGTGSAAGTTAPSTTPSAQHPARRPAGPASDLVHGPRTRPQVALTFHGAGDPALTRRAMSVAADAGAGLTVLAVGSWLADNPALARALLDAGHDLGNHTWHHLPMRTLDARQAREEIARTADLLRRLTGGPGRWFRPSGTPRSTALIRAAARSAGYRRCLAYDVDPRDYEDPGAAVVTRRVLAAVRPGSVVSLHLGHRGTVTALPDILRGLHSRQLRAVTVTRLMGDR